MPLKIVVTMVLTGHIIILLGKNDESKFQKINEKGKNPPFLFFGGGIML